MTYFARFQCVSLITDHGSFWVLSFPTCNLTSQKQCQWVHFVSKFKTFASFFPSSFFIHPPTLLSSLHPPGTSLFPVFKGGLCHLWPLRQALSEHVDIILWGPAHQPGDAQLPHWRRGPVHPAAAAVHQRCSAVTAWPLWLESICLPLRHRQR